MPIIRQYTATADKLQPADTGFQAEEMAGRRIGPLYNEISGNQKEGGRLAGEVIGEDKLGTMNWNGSDRARVPGGGGFRIQQFGGGGRGGNGGGTRYGGSYAARNLTGTAASLVSRGGKMIDTGAGTPTENGWVSTDGSPSVDLGLSPGQVENINDKLDPEGINDTIAGLMGQNQGSEQSWWTSAVSSAMQDAGAVFGAGIPSNMNTTPDTSQAGQDAAQNVVSDAPPNVMLGY